MILSLCLSLLVEGELEKSSCGEERAGRPVEPSQAVCNSSNPGSPRPVSDIELILVGIAFIHLHRTDLQKSERSSVVFIWGTYEVPSPLSYLNSG